MVDAAIDTAARQGHGRVDASTTTSSRPLKSRRRRAGHEHRDTEQTRSVPKPVFTDAEAGAKEFPSSMSRRFNYFTPAKRRASVYEDVTDRRPARSRAPPDAGLDLRLRRRHPRLPAGVDGAQVRQLAPLPRSQRGVGADDLSQQRERRPPDPAEHRERQGRTLLPELEPCLGRRRGEARERLGARRARSRHARLHPRAAGRADEHDQQRARGRGGAQAALRAGHHPLQPRAHGRDRGLRRPGPHRDLAGRSDLAADARARRAADRHARLGRGVLRDRRWCSSRWSASCSAASS